MKILLKKKERKMKVVYFFFFKVKVLIVTTGERGFDPWMSPLETGGWATKLLVNI